MSTVNPVVLYCVFALLGILLILYGIIGNRLERKQTVLNYISNKQVYKGFLDQLLDNIPFVLKREKNMDKKISVLGTHYSARTITKIEITAVILAITVDIHFKNILLLIPLIPIFVSLPATFIETRVNKKIKLFNEQILEAFQIFITDYTTTKSVRKTLVNICPKLKYPLRSEFELLSRKLNSGESVETSFKSFADRVQNKWILIFSQMMIAYAKNGGDFIPQLLNITKNITNEKILQEQNITELSSLRTMNLVMNACVPIAYIIDWLLNPDSARIFVTTSNGKTIIFLVMVFCWLSLYLGKKISEF